MYNTTDLYKNLAHISGRDWNVKARIVLKDSTELNIDDSDIIVGGLEWIHATSDQGAFTLGATVIGEIVLQLNNSQGEFTQYDFTDAVIYPQVGLTTQIHWRDGKIIEWIPIGEFTTDEARSVGTTIKINALGNLSKCDKPYSESTLKYPATLAQISLDVCTRRGLTLATTTFTNSDYVVTTRPSDSSITDREILSCVAKLAGCFCRENRNGEIEFAWYDFSRFTTPTPGGKLPPAEFRTSNTYNIDASDVTITGVQIIPSTSGGTVYTHGTEGYVAKIENNPLAQSNLQGLVDSVGNKLVGMTFRPYSVTTLSDPSIDCGDVVLVTDTKGVIHKSIVSNSDFKIDSLQSFSGDAESQNKNQSVRFTSADKAQGAADNAQNTADQANAGVAQANIRIGNLEISIQGKVSFSDLSGSGTTTINGSNITTGKISADRIDTTDLAAAKLMGPDDATTYVAIGPHGSSGGDMPTVLMYGAANKFFAFIRSDATPGNPLDEIYSYDRMAIVAGGASIAVNVNGTTSAGYFDSSGWHGKVNGNDFSGGVTTGTVLQGADGSRVGLTFTNGILTSTY